MSLVTLFPCVLYYIRYEGYQEALESEKKKEVELEAMKEQFSGMQSQIQSLIMAFANMKEQTQFDSMAKTLYDSHILGKEATTAVLTSPNSTPTSTRSSVTTTAAEAETIPTQTSMTTAKEVTKAADSSDSSEEEDHNQQHNHQQKSKNTYKNNS